MKGNDKVLSKKWELVNFCEIDKYATASYCAIHNVDKSLNLNDVTAIDTSKIADFTMLCGGSPCQDFSVAGKQAGAMWTCKTCGHKYNPLEAHFDKREFCPHCGGQDIEKTRSSLLVEYLRVLRGKMPKFAVYENVKNIVGKSFKQTFDLFINELHEYGYNTYYKVLNAKDFGVPQNRERLYLVAIRKDIDNGKFEFPKGFDNGIRLKDVLETEVDDKYYLSEETVKRFISNENTKTSLLYDGCQSKREGKSREYNDYAPTLSARDYKDPRMVNDNAVQQVGNYRPDSENFSNPQTGRVYSAEGISPTLNTMQGGDRQPKVITGIDKSVKNTREIEYANCITAREDRGVSNRQAEGTAVIEMNEPFVVASRGRYKNGTDGETEQNFEPNITGNSNTITTVVKDNYVCEPINTMPDGNCRTIKAQYQQTSAANLVRTSTFGATGVAEYHTTEPNTALVQPVDRDYNKHGTERKEHLEFKNDGISHALRAQIQTYCQEPSFRIRKLTPRECYRLMSFTDEDFEKAEKVCSNSQLYKQAGNSIVVDVLYYIYVELYKVMPELFEDLTLTSLFSGIGAFECALNKLYKAIENGENFTTPQTE